MPRPQKTRYVGSKPKCNRFNPLTTSQDEIVLTLDEFETIKWIDVENLSQENCASIMSVSRTTIQRTYASARKKLGLAIVNGLNLTIGGGPIIEEERSPFKEHVNEKGELSMKIAIGLDQNQVSMHFGSCNDFRIVEVNNMEVTKTEDIHDESSTHHDRPQFLKNLGVDVLILGGIGKGAYNRLVPLGIECINGAGKSADEALQAYLNQTLTSALEAHACSGNHDHKHDHSHQHHHNHSTSGNKGKGRA